MGSVIGGARSRHYVDPADSVGEWVHVAVTYDGIGGPAPSNAFSTELCVPFALKTGPFREPGTDLLLGVETHE